MREREREVKRKGMKSTPCVREGKRRNRERERERDLREREVA